MIKELHIKNFQRHDNTRIKFTEGLNIIKGPSDSGKSSIIRALRWCLFNKPNGFGFKKWKSTPKDKTSCRIIFNDGSEILRERNDTVNQYIINKTVKRDKIKSDLPVEVSQVSNLSGHNLAYQHDGYFLLNSSPGEVARQFNAIAGLDIIDKSLKNSNSAIDDSKKKIKIYTESIAELESKLKEAEYLDEIEPLLVKIETNIKEAEQIDHDKYFRLIPAKEEIQYYKQKIEALTIIIKQEKSLNKLMDNILNLKEIETQIANLNFAFVEITTLNETINQLMSEHIIYEEDLSKLTERVNRFLELYKQHGDLEELYREIKQRQQFINENKDVVQKDITIDKIIESITQLNQIDQDIQDLKSDYKEIKDEMTFRSNIKSQIEQKYNDYRSLMLKAKVCPACGKPLSKTDIDHCLKELV